MGFLLEVDDKGTCRCVLWLILGHGGSGGVVEVLWVFFFFLRWWGSWWIVWVFFFFFLEVACECDDGCFGQWCWSILMGFVVGC